MSMEVVPAERTLDELAETANRGHAAVSAAAASLLEHAIATGEAIHTAHEAVLAGGGAWGEWVSDRLTFSTGHAYRYERLYVYRTHLPDAAFCPSRDNKSGRIEPPSMHRAEAFLRGLPPIRPVGYPHHSEEVKAAARKMRSEGATISEIEAVLGVTRNTVIDWAGRTPEQMAKRRAANAERRAAKNALIRERRMAEARRASDALGEVYANTRRSLQLADREHAAAETPAVRRELAALISDLHRAEDRLGRIIRMAGEEAA